MSITVMIVVVTAVISFMAFGNSQLIDKLLFYPYRMWRFGEWHRLISNAFIHADMGHLLFNMIALWSFGTYVERAFSFLFPFGTSIFVLMYFGAVAVADAYHLFSMKDNPGYKSLGASGGVAAVVFASILLQPQGGISIMFLPSIPAYIFGPLYLLYSAYMAKRGGDNIGHVAHFTGSVVGFFLPIVLKPSLFARFLEQVFG